MALIPIVNTSFLSIVERSRDRENGKHGMSLLAYRHMVVEATNAHERPSLDVMCGSLILTGEYFYLSTPKAKPAMPIKPAGVEQEG
ncbi:hypothetical protein PTI98_006922 [Pleurotus ostreatus]|nr:hypothetical protein PTI98_006922 [Pleurotus ostreatus]